MPSEVKPGSKPAAKPAYDKLFKDGVLDITVGIGASAPANWDQVEVKELRRGLQRDGFSPLAMNSITADQRARYRIDPRGEYYVKKFTHEGERVSALVHVIEPRTSGAKEQFAEAFAKGDVVMYAGHARYGSGPDFDSKESQAGNFVMGTPYDEHMKALLQGVPNDLQQAQMTPDYQLMLFHGCTSSDYLDDLRSIPNKDSSNLDVIASDKEVGSDRIAENLLTSIGGIIGTKSAEELRESLVRSSNGVPYVTDGFQDNE